MKRRRKDANRIEQIRILEELNGCEVIGNRTEWIITDANRNRIEHCRVVRRRAEKE